MPSRERSALTPPGGSPQPLPQPPPQTCKYSSGPQRAGHSRWTSRRQTRSRRSSAWCRTKSASRPTSSACSGPVSSWPTAARWPTTTSRTRARCSWRCGCAVEERTSVARAPQLRRRQRRPQLRSRSLPLLLRPGKKQSRPHPHSPPRPSARGAGPHRTCVALWKGSRSSSRQRRLRTWTHGPLPRRRYRRARCSRPRRRACRPHWPAHPRSRVTILRRLSQMLRPRAHRGALRNGPWMSE